MSVQSSWNRGDRKLVITTEKDLCTKKNGAHEKEEMDNEGNNLFKYEYLDFTILLFLYIFNKSGKKGSRLKY